MIHHHYHHATTFGWTEETCQEILVEQVQTALQGSLMQLAWKASLKRVPWQEMSAVEMSRQNWAASYRVGFETDDLGLEILSPLWVWSRDPNWRHYLWAKPWLRGTGLSLSSLCLEWTELWDRIVGAKGIRSWLVARLCSWGKMPKQW